jgi:L-lactate dehydrogenase
MAAPLYISKIFEVKIVRPKLLSSRKGLLMPKLTPKVSIIGCGNVGARYAYSLMIKGVAREMVLVDYAREKAEGEAMDLAHGAPYVSPVQIYAGDYPDTRDSDLVVVTAGRGQKAGETRVDLVKGNAEIFRAIIPQIVKYSPNAIILIASNPVDILSYVAWKISGKPAPEIIGSGTVLDSARFRYFLSQRCDVDPRSVHAWILGEHGDSEFPWWSGANLGGVKFADFCAAGDCRLCGAAPEETRAEIFRATRDAAYNIIAKKRETSYGIGLALTKISSAVLKNQNSVLPVSTLLQDYYGVSDVYLSVPTIVNRAGARQTLKVDFDATELAAFKSSAEKMRAVITDSGF